VVGTDVVDTVEKAGVMERGGHDFSSATVRKSNSRVADKIPLETLGDDIPVAGRGGMRGVYDDVVGCRKVDRQQQKNLLQKDASYNKENDS